MKYSDILRQIKKQQFAPVYYLHGEEAFFLDKIAEALLADGAVITESEAAFNRNIFYGPETTANHLLTACRSFPVMATRRLVLLREAHRMAKKEIEKLTPYFRQPVASTVLALVFKDPKIGLPKEAATLISKSGVDFPTPKMYERDVISWAAHLIQEEGLAFPPELPSFLVENLGPQLSLIENELEKIFITLKAAGKSVIDMDLVHEFIQVDKEFNTFELVHAISLRDMARAYMIIDRLARNLKNNPAVLTVSSLFRFFHHVALVHRLKLQDPNAIKTQLGANFYQARDYAEASRRYPAHIVFRNIGFIHQADLELKGISPTQLDEAHVLKTLVWRLMS